MLPTASVVPAVAPTITVPNAMGAELTEISAGSRRSTRTGRWSETECSAVAYAAPSGIVGGSWMLLLWWSPSLPTEMYEPGTSSRPAPSLNGCVGRMRSKRSSRPPVDAPGAQPVSPVLHGDWVHAGCIDVLS